MGADRAILVLTGSDPQPDVEPLAIAKVLKAIVEQEKPHLVLCGKQAIDNDMNAAGQMLSALLGWSQATFASSLTIENELAIVTREIDGGLQTLRVKLPAVVTVDLRLNEPRYANLVNIIKAKKKPLEETTVEQLGVDIRPRLRIVRTTEPAARESGEILPDVDTLVTRLKQRGVV
jgi:electron transfer flavoprotein beta subunit